MGNQKTLSQNTDNQAPWSEYASGNRAGSINGENSGQ